MNGKLKALGLALLAAFAMSAVAASTAHANNGIKFTGEEENVVITGEELNPEAEGTDFLEATAGRRVECDNATYESTISEPTTILTVTPHYDDKNGCTANPPGVKATVHLNGCDFTFEAISHENEGKTVKAQAGIKCPEGKEITVTVATCTIHIPEQTGLTGITLHNEPANGKTPKPWVLATINIQNQITYTETDALFCPFEGSTHTGEGDFVSEVALKGYKDTTPDSVDATGTTEYTHESTPVGIHVGTME